jgi:hypothetical protein
VRVGFVFGERGKMGGDAGERRAVFFMEQRADEGYVF